MDDREIYVGMAESSWCQKTVCFSQEKKEGMLIVTCFEMAPNR